MFHSQYLDPHTKTESKKSSSIYWGLVRVFPRDWILCFSMSVIMVRGSSETFDILTNFLSGGL